MRVFSVDEIRRLDSIIIEGCGLPSHSLMEVAGNKVFQEVERRFGRVKSIFVLCGRGNNGGDGLVIARLFLINGARVSLLLMDEIEKCSPDLIKNYEILKKVSSHLGSLEEFNFNTVDIEDLRDRILNSDLIIDALLGTGIKSEVRGDYRRLISFINSLSVSSKIVAVDIPSGLNGDTGSPVPEAIRAAYTVTIGGHKIGLYSYPAPEYTGEVVVVDIGLPQILASGPLLEVADHNIYRGRLIRRNLNFHKGSSGHAAVVAGSRDKRGAAYIAVLGLLRIGSGLVTLVSENEVTEGITQIHPEVMTRVPDLYRADKEYFSEIFSGIDTLVIGPGLSDDENVLNWCKSLITSSDKFMVLDAEAFRLIGDKRFNDNKVVLTPHPLELSRLIGLSRDEIQKDRIGTAKMCASKYNAVCVLKGARSVIAAPDGRITINTTGNPLMASGGMGDLLSGIIGGLICQSGSVYDAARMGAYIHGFAADILVEQKGSPLIASDVAAAIREAVHRSGIYG